MPSNVRSGLLRLALPFFVLFVATVSPICREAVGQGTQPAPAPQSATPVSPAVPTTPAAVPDPLAVGKAALNRNDFASAHDFFAKFAADNPASSDGQLYLGLADLGLTHYAEAEKEFQASLKLKPGSWDAHQSLALAYAQAGDWASFDKERAAIKAGRAAGAPGLSTEGHDLIDLLHINGDVFQVWYFPTLHGRFHTRYVVLHFNANGQADRFIQCESDDVDQIQFKQAHPKEAAAGDRSFSLDTYSVSSSGMSQGLIKFYPDGEPSYETVRADALKVLNGQNQPAATTATPSPTKH